MSEKYAASGPVMLTVANATGAEVLFVTVRFSVRGKQNASGLRFNVLGAAVTTPGGASTVKYQVMSPFIVSLFIVLPAKSVTPSIFCPSRCTSLMILAT